MNLVQPAMRRPLTVVVLVIAVASRRLSVHLPFVDHLPHGTWVRAGIALGVLAALAASHLASAWVTARTAAESQQTVRRMLVDAYLGADWPAQSRERMGNSRSSSRPGLRW